MKKLPLSLAVLIALVLIALWNLRHVDTLIGELTGEVENARTCWEQGAFEEAEGVLSRALADWAAADSYTHVFIRHAEIDTAADAFYELLSAVREGDAEQAGAAADKLLYHLRSIRDMEHVTIKSVF